MKRSLIVFAAAGTIFGAAAEAFEFNGGELSLGYSAFSDDTDISKLSVTGSAEFGFSRAFSVQLDAGSHAFNFVDENGTNISAHGIFHANEQLSLGAFYGVDRFNGDSADFYGLELGYELPNVDLEGYVARGEESGVSADVFGLDGKLKANETLDVMASIDHASFDGGLDLTRFSVGGVWKATPGIGLYAELGSVKADALGFSDSEGYVGIGATFTFGADRGATFGRRSTFELIPGL